jgi:hypothetical protein
MGIGVGSAQCRRKGRAKTTSPIAELRMIRIRMQARIIGGPFVPRRYVTPCLSRACGIGDNVALAEPTLPTRRHRPRLVQSAKELTLAKDDPKTSIDAGGLRYRSKVAGSPFSATGAFGAATMSCFLCGKHRPRAQLKSRKLLGKAQAVCSPSCKELDAAQS